MSSDSQLLHLGEEILSKHINDTEENLPPKQNQDQIYIKCLELSRFLVTIGKPPCSLTSANIKSIQNLVDEIVALLSSIGKPPSYDVGPGSSIFEAFNIITYSLLLIQKSPSQSNNGSDDLQQKYDSLLESSTQGICELEKLKAANQKLVRENQHLSKISKDYHKLIDALNSKFDLPKNSELTDIYAIISSNENNENNFNQNDQLSDKDQEIADLLTSRESQAKIIHNLKEEIKALKLVNHEENINARIYVLETDISSLRLQNQTLTTDLSKQKDRYRSLDQKYQNISNELKTKAIEIESLQMQLNKLLIERDELKNVLNIQQTLISDSNIKSKEDQILGMNSAFNEFSKQIEAMTEELSSVSESRNQLFELLNKQKMVLDAYGQLQLKFSSELNDDKADNNDHNFNNKGNNGNNYILTKISEISFDKEINDILLDESQNANERIIAAFSKLIQQKEELFYNFKDHIENNEGKFREDDDNQKSLEKENERLCLYLMSVHRFLDKVANSSETQDWMISCLNTSEIRDALVAQCKRVESFIKQRSIGNEGNCFEFTEMPKYVSQNLNEISDKNELITIVQQSALANDILRKYLLKVEEHMDTLSQELKTMKFELSHTESSIESSTISLRDELDAEIANKHRLEDELKAIRNELSKELSGMEKAKVAHHAGRVLKSKDVDEYVLMLETKLKDASKRNENLSNEIGKITDEAKNAVHLLKKQILSLQNAIKESESNKEEILQKLEITQNNLLETEQNLQKCSEDNRKLNETINEMTISFSSFNEQKQKEIETIANEIANKANDKMLKLKEEINQKNIELNNKDEDQKLVVKQLKKENKEEIKKIQSELEKQAKRATDLRNHYEPLLAEIRQKLQECREKLTENALIVQNHENESKELKNELSAAKIEIKMSSMKLTANEEKMKRDRSLFETQLKMKLMSMEAAHSSQLERTKAQLDKQLHDFLVQISGDFKEFVDFNSPITTSSTVKMLQIVRQNIDSLNTKISGLNKYFDEVGDIRTVLDLSKDSDILPYVASLVKKVKDYSKNTENFDKIDQLMQKQNDSLKTEEALQKWEKWAKRLHATVTDEFSFQKSPKELQFVIEEALMSAIGQRQIWRHAEILRAEKVLLLKMPSIMSCSNNSNANCNVIINNNNCTNNKNMAIVEKPRTKDPDFLILSLCFCSIYRLQKLSGHLHSTITFQEEPSQRRRKKSKSKNKVCETEQEAQKKYPILICD